MADKKVIEALNAALTAEITAIGVYMDHHARIDDLGYPKLAEEFEEEAVDEMKHAEKLMKRLLRLGAPLEYRKHDSPEPTKDVMTMLKTDIALEEKAIKMYNESIKVCTAAGDAVTRKLFEELLTDEDKHLNALEDHRDLLKKHGEQYLLIKG